MNALSNVAEKVLGGHPTSIQGDVSNPGNDNSKWADPSGEKMQALVWLGKNNVAMEQVPKPALIDDQDVILKVTGSTVCGSDLHLYHGSIIELQKHDILGHEFCGVVEKVGPKVTKVQPGDRVVASFQIACGDCEYCKKGLSSMCEKTNASSLQNAMYGNRTAGMFGYSHFTGGFAGGQSEYVRVPYGNANLLKIPKEVPDEKALYLSDVLATSYHAVVDTGVQKGDTVAIWGAGPIGLFVAKFSFLKGAKRVVLIDSNWRLDYCKSKIPELETLDYSTVDVKKGVSGTLREMIPVGVDCAIECASGEFAKGYLAAFETAIGLQTDTSEIVNEMILSVKKFGRCGITGVYAGFTNHFNIGAVMETGIRFIGNGQAPVHKYWKELLYDYIIPGKIDPLMMVTHRIDISETAEVYKVFDQKKDGMMKVFIQTRFSDPPSAGAPPLTSLL